MKQHNDTIQKFYTALAAGNYGEMKDLYHPEARFSDPVFRDLPTREIHAMWEMLILAGSDLKIVHDGVKTDDNSGSCRWQAWYTFSGTGRMVHNVIYAQFEFKDGKIFRHNDHFDFWRWSRMALGVSGVVFGWTPFLQSKVRATARKRLARFMNKKTTELSKK